LRDPRWFRAWAYRIATRQALRRAKGERFWTDAAREETLETLREDSEVERFDPELIAALGEALDRVPRASQLVLRMHYLDELTYEEIAEALEIPSGTAKSRAAYGLRFLRESFRPA
jgi:RNA polymerase sigma-70 factor (ECF subfamily)